MYAHREPVFAFQNSFNVPGVDCLGVRKAAHAILVPRGQQSVSDRLSLCIWTLNAGHENCPVSCGHRTSTWVAPLRNPDDVELRSSGFDVGSAELMFADELCQRVHAVRVVAVGYKYLRTEPLQLRVESPLGRLLCTVHAYPFSNGEDLIRDIAELLGVMLCDVVPVIHEQEHDVGCLNTLWEQGLHHGDAIWLRNSWCNW